MTAPAPSRRHDLDALRAFAMLLGIGLHAALSFTPFPWPAQDSRQDDIFELFFVVVHGFRMPLFFVVSGFFTAMLWRQKGVQALLKHRFQRVFIPCLLGLVTIIPMTHWAMRSGTRGVQEVVKPANDLLSAIRKHDAASVERLIVDGTDVNQADPDFKVKMLSWAAMVGDVDSTRLLLDHGADVNAANGDGSTPLHSAVFLGHPAIARQLLDAGADPAARNERGHVPAHAAQADWELTQFLAGLLKIPLRSEDEVRTGREECRKLLPASSQPEAAASGTEGGEFNGQLRAIRSAYAAWLGSDIWKVRWSATASPLHLIHTDVFVHLWFLWFLCWLAPLFAASVWIAERVGLKALPRWLVLSPARMCWLLPLTLLPQLLMGTLSPSFGPDTSVGVIPQPHLLFYYGIFFGFGVLYFVSDDSEGRMGRWWWMTLPTALLVLLPIGLQVMPFVVMSSVVQVGYVWLMTFGSIGLCRRLLTRESRAIRYVSDSSYWLYLAHLPLVIAAQHLIRDWPIPAVPKFLLLCAAVTGILLLSYHTLVRYTWIGALLNGRRTRPNLAACSAPSMGH